MDNPESTTFQPMPNNITKYIKGYESPHDPLSPNQTAVQHRLKYHQNSPKSDLKSTSTTTQHPI